ncbi:hypothetical protein [Sphingomonas sp. SRS2]|uniref:hypothetical protein n=1 Tax=Sphingomonas sp. SRS2 TaxID=133190 RepID=UPI00128CD906|nr:hypothetical protein [Sphingomonas sp. SRS2]
MLFAASAATAAMTPAGTTISNVARIDYRVGTGAVSRASNRVDIRVGEIIDFSVTAAPPCAGGAGTGGVVAIGFRITNLGNGSEAFIPGSPSVTGGSNFVPAGVIADSNGNGCYDPGVDQPIPPGGKTPPLAPGQSIIVFVIGTGGNGIGELVLPVTSETGTGRRGTAIPGGGQGGSDAVIGDSGGVVTQPVPAPRPLIASLVKSQSVRAPDDSTEPRSGAVITYRIEGSFAGIGMASDVAIADSIPAGTSYVADSLTLDGVKISDAADGDNGLFNGTGIAVRLGDVAAPTVHAISFQVRIN